MPAAPATHAFMAMNGDAVADDGGLRRRHELVDEVAYVPSPDRAIDDLTLLDDDASPLLARVDSRRPRVAVRDPADGIPL